MKRIITGLLLAVCLIGCVKNFSDTKNPPSCIRGDPLGPLCWKEQSITFPMSPRSTFSLEDECYSVGDRLYRIGSLEYVGWYDLKSEKSGYVQFFEEPYYVEMWGEGFAFIHENQAVAYLTDEKFNVQKIFTSPVIQEYLDRTETSGFMPLWDFSATVFPDGGYIQEDGQQKYLPFGLFMARNRQDTAELIYPVKAVFDRCESISEKELFLSYEYPAGGDGSLPKVQINSIFNIETRKEIILPTKGECQKNFKDHKNGNLYFKDGFYHIASQRFVSFQPQCDDAGYIVAQNRKAYYFRDGRLILYDFFQKKEIITKYRMPKNLDPNQQLIFWVKPDGSQLAFGSPSPQCDTIYLLEPEKSN